MEAAAERALVTRASRGDQGAFRALVERHQARAYGLALRITRSAPDAEEVAQDAFVRAWLALPRFRGESSFATWLYRIVARRALDRAAVLRARRGREADVDEADALPAGGALARDLESEVRARRLERMVMTLAMPENTVKTHLSRARAALRKAWLREEDA
ncbi:MAG: sigma-70 family RNA polymerase sigma factor [Candidatus Eisenbacteria bacterium]|nr:sigma-70 family RNA polymerase sigma factor [Candidatus Eisenbacteria bacterium]